MKRCVAFTLIVFGLSVLAFERDAWAQRFRYRNYSRNYYDYYYHRSPVLGIRSPYVRSRRPLNVPQSNLRSRPRSVVYFYPQPAAINPLFSAPPIPTVPNSWLSGYPSYLSYGNIPLYNSSNIRVIGPWQPTIIEREKIFIERQPIQIAKDTEATPQYHSESSSPDSAQELETSDDFSAQLKRAKDLFQDRKYQESEEAYRQASGLNPGDASVKIGQTLACLAMGEYVDAGSALRRALLLKPVWNEKPILLATYYGDLNDFNAHLARLERFVQSHKTHSEAQFLLAYLYYAIERADDAAGLLATILDAHPNDLEATTLLGRIASTRTLMQK